MTVVMLSKVLSVAVLFYLNSFNLLHAQGKTFLDSLVGTWKGTSICQVKNSPCHDEIVVYRITRGRTADSCNIAASKIVNGVEDDMGSLPCRIQPKNDLVLSTAYDSKWEFKMTKEKLDGTLYSRNSLYRIIKLTKIP